MNFPIPQNNDLPCDSEMRDMSNTLSIDSESLVLGLRVTLGEYRTVESNTVLLVSCGVGQKNPSML